MKREIKCPKCGSEKRVKSGFNNKKQRYYVKNVVVTILEDEMGIRNISEKKL